MSLFVQWIYFPIESIRKECLKLNLLDAEAKANNKGEGRQTVLRKPKSGALCNKISPPLLGNPEYAPMWIYLLVNQLFGVSEC